MKKLELCLLTNLRYKITRFAFLLSHFKELNYDSNKMADGAEQVSVSKLEQPNLGESLVNQQTDKMVDELDVRLT